jgi:hypothetical protein
MIADDPFGRYGPNINDFLSIQKEDNEIVNEEKVGTISDLNLNDGNQNGFKSANSPPQPLTIKKSETKRRKRKNISNSQTLLPNANRLSFSNNNNDKQLPGTETIEVEDVENIETSKLEAKVFEEPQQQQLTISISEAIELEQDDTPPIDSLAPIQQKKTTEREKLFKTLSDIFPKSETNTILFFLRKYPNKKEISFFIRKILTNIRFRQ